MAVLTHILKTDFKTYCGLPRHLGMGKQPHVSDAKHATCRICGEQYNGDEWRTIMSGKIILYSGNEAACRKTVTGWVSSNGTFFGDGPDAEHAARYDGCTHVSCAICGKPVKKPYYTCPECCRDKVIKKYNKMPEVEYDGKAPLYSEEKEEYFQALSDAYDYAEENGTTVDDLRLVICKPVFLEEIDEDYWEEDLAEDAELPADIREAVGRLNKLLREHGPVSFEPGSARPKL